MKNITADEPRDESDEAGGEQDNQVVHGSLFRFVRQGMPWKISVSVHAGCERREPAPLSRRGPSDHKSLESIDD
ncbi:MAG: hypothetical protein WCE51_14130 [Chthoniobacterales bacterium]